MFERSFNQHTYANSETDINSELDELDREEFYRLKKVELVEFATDQIIG